MAGSTPASAATVSGPARPGRRFRRRIAIAIWVAAAASLALAAAIALACCGARDRRRVVLLGIDGMDHGLTCELMAEGRLPNFTALAREGTFLPLRTSMPPLSPVAWTCLTTGMNPGGHGIFDFLGRDPAKVTDGFLPHNAVSALTADASAWPWRIPFTRYVWPPRQRHALRRRGTPFWDILAGRGIDAVIYKMPANFPTSPSTAQTLAGMCTPDVEGTYGTFTYITDRRRDWGRKISGGRILKAVLDEGVVRIASGRGKSGPWLCGPVNPFLPEEADHENRRARVHFQVYADRAERAAVIVLQGQEALVRQGEWSPWLRVEFRLLPHVKSVHGLVRFYLQEAGESLRLFASPVNLAPGADGLATGGLDERLLDALGPYYTKGMAEQTKALTQGLFTPGEYIAQSDLVLAERLEALEALMSRCRSGFLFFYISTLDPDCHVLWKHHDPSHPAHDEKASRPYADVIRQRYVKMDEVLGQVRSRLRPEDVLYVISDHGFGPFHTEFNLASWLERHGYLLYTSFIRKRLSEFYADIDWSRTRAYPVGFNGLYLNLKGREAEGIVHPQERGRLVEEIRAGLLAFRDTHGKAVFRNVYRPEDLYSGACMHMAPDLILGYDRGYGPSDDAALGTWSEEPVGPHLDGFSGHHCVDFTAVPGVFFCTRKLPVEEARLEDVTVTILKDFGIPPAGGMTGKPLY